MAKRPEIDLLLACARRSLDGGTAGRIRRRLGLQLDWDLLLKKSALHGMAPLLWHHVVGSGLADRLPAHVSRNLQQNFLANSARNMVLSRETVNLVRVLATAGIDALPHKGPVLAELAYGDLALRGYSDLDILIRQREYPAGRNVLEDLGYQAHSLVVGDIEGFGLESTDQAGFCHAESGIVVELQWGLMPECWAERLDFDECLARAASVEIDGQQIKTLGREDMVFALAIHGSKHLWSRIEWLASFGAFIEDRAGDIDWESVLEKPRNVGQLRMLLLGFWMAKQLLRIEVPVTLPNDTRVAEAGEMICRHFEEGSEDEMLDPVRRFSALAAFGSPQSRLRQWVRVVIQPTPAEWECVRLPGWLYFLYYPFRPVRLGWRHVRRRLRRRARGGS